VGLDGGFFGSLSKCLDQLRLHSLNNSSPLLPPAPVSRRAAGGAGGGAEFGAGLARVGRLEDFASGARACLVGRRFARRCAAGTIGQGFRAVHFVEMGFVDAGGGSTVVAEGFHPAPRACGARPSPTRGG
jgi:hypothetical protein